MGQVVRVRSDILRRLREEAARAPETECCGLLAGRDGVITTIFLAPNALGSATAFEIAPVELFRIFRTMRAEGLEHLGIYHSHPRGENAPSARDLEQAYYPDVAYFILSPDPVRPRPVRAFVLREGRFQEIEIQSV